MITRTLMRQLSFYAGRLRKENITKMFAVSAASLALVIQMTAGIIPAAFGNDTAQAAGDDNIVRYGVKDKADMLAVYDRGTDGAGHNDIKQIYTHFGVSRQDIANSTMGTYKSNDFNGNLKTIGRTNWQDSGRYPVKVADSSTTVYTGPFLNGDNNNPVVQPALIGKRSIDGQWFAITLDCANIVYVTPPKQPEPPKPQPKPAAVCESLSIAPLTRNSVKLSARATTSNGATVSAFQYVITKDGREVLNRTVETTGTSSAINYTAPSEGTYTARVTVQTSVGARTADACAKTFTVTPKPVTIKKIEVCELATKDTITINEDDFDDSKHSRDFDDCKEAPKPEYLEVCILATKEIKMINKNDYDTSKHSTDLSDCDEEVVVTPAPETPAELPKTGVADAISGALGLGSIIAGFSYYATSRRSLLAAWLNR